MAIVTGAGRGIGAAIARGLASQGAKVVVNDLGVTLAGEFHGPDQAADDVVAQILASGGIAMADHHSVAAFAEAEAIVDAALDRFGRVDILVNNAGIVRDRVIEKMSEADYDAVVGVHQKGTFNTTHHVVPHMKESGFGRIVNVTATAGLAGNFGQSNYAAAKAAVVGMTFVWAVELARYGITVNAVAPNGYTRMTEGLYQGSEPPASEAADLNAPLVTFLCSEAAAHVNGQVLGREGFGFSLFSTPRQVATMWREGGWTPEELAEQFERVLGAHLQPVGMRPHPILTHND